MTTAGKDIIAYCSSCKLDLAHIIVAKNEEKIVKVECNTCHKTHVFRPPKGDLAKKKKKKSAKAKGTTRKSKKVVKSVAEEWSEQMALKTDTKVTPYIMANSFQAGDVISHPKFGNGIVMKVMGTQKFEAMFEDSIKLMAQGRN